MTRIGLYMNDLGLHDTSHEMALSGIKPLPQLEMARDHVSFQEIVRLKSLTWRLVHTNTVLLSETTTQLNVTIKRQGIAR